MFKKQLAIVVFTLCALSAFAQVKISGVVYNEYLEPFYNAKITSGGGTALSDVSGNFTITLNGKLPQRLEISAFGHQTEFIDVEKASQKINVILKENLILDQVVISASRVPERIIESPVTIERFGLNEIKRTTSNSFYDGLANLKSIQSREGSYGYKSINTRGFSDFSNSRFVQLVDGMDTAAPALNFSAGNLSGVTELDIHNVEILPGASSALYGANSYNGILLMNTKNPFDFTGVSAQFKTGIMSQDLAGNNEFYDASIRMAHKFSESFAAKVDVSYFDAPEWQANDLRNRQIDTGEIIDGSQNSVLSYDGINLYGDEVTQNLTGIARFLGFNLPEAYTVNLTGYRERELLRSYRTNNLKFSTSLHYRPLEDESLEFIFSSRLARGNGLFQGTSRFAQRNYFIGQVKLEAKGDNFFVRAYRVFNDAGQTYDLTRTGIALNTIAAQSNRLGSWGVDYFLGLANNGGFNPDNSIIIDPTILAAARAEADRTRLIPGSSEFNEQFNNITSTFITEGGSRIYDSSYYSHLDANYNFTSLLNDWADVQVGGSFRGYNADSKGTIFNDADQVISIDEYGIYTQIQKKLLDDRLKLTGSIRYDKSENFDGNYSPRFAINYALGEDKNHILRTSYQTGFRNPTIQEQYLLIPAGRKINVGTSLPNLATVDVNGITGDDIINNSLLTRTVFPEDTGYQGPRNVRSTYKPITPEEVQTIEFGYRSMFGITDSNNLIIDFNTFYSFHNDFVFFQDVIVPTTGTIYPFGDTPLTATQLADPNLANGIRNDDGVLVLDAASINSGLVEFNMITNSKSLVNSYGASIAVSTKIASRFDLGLSYDYIDFTFDDEDFGLFEPNFNTPKHTFRAQLGNENLFDNFGFNVNLRWLDKYRWVSPFIKGDVDARTVLDAQLNYRIPSIKSVFKVGGTNLLGKEYLVAPGNGSIGSLYYISLTINN